jgi:hypothetical protein
VGLQVLNVASHLYGSQAFRDGDQTAHRLANKPPFFETVHHARVRNAPLVKSQEHRVMGEQHATLGGSESELVFVTCVHRTDFYRSGDVNSVSPETFSDYGVNVFIEVESNRWRHYRVSLISVASTVS